MRSVIEQSAKKMSMFWNIRFLIVNVILNGGDAKMQVFAVIVARILETNVVFTNNVMTTTMFQDTGVSNKFTHCF